MDTPILQGDKPQLDADLQTQAFILQADMDVLCSLKTGSFLVRVFREQSIISTIWTPA
tara:strand:- start:295 stop:468 length:174 start_codon:yes stop_codon:yes gene_type:complete